MARFCSLHEIRFQHANISSNSKHNFLVPIGYSRMSMMTDYRKQLFHYDILEILIRKTLYYSNLSKGDVELLNVPI